MDVVVDVVSSVEDVVGVNVAVVPATSKDGRVIPGGPSASLFGAEEQLAEITQAVTRIDTGTFMEPRSGKSNSSSEESPGPAEMHRGKDDG